MMKSGDGCVTIFGGGAESKGDVKTQEVERNDERVRI